MRSFRDRPNRWQRPSPAVAVIFECGSRCAWVRAGSKRICSPDAGAMSARQFFDAAGRPRSPGQCPGIRPGAVRGQGPAGIQPIRPTVDEIVAVMRQARDARPRSADARSDCRVVAGRPPDPRGAHAVRNGSQRAPGSLLVRHARLPGVGKSRWPLGVVYVDRPDARPRLVADGPAFLRDWPADPRSRLVTPCGSGGASKARRPRLGSAALWRHQRRHPTLGSCSTKRSRRR
jgi:hypothetical protein